MKRRDWILGLAGALAIAVLLSPFASSLPDGLEWGAAEAGLVEQPSDGPIVSSPLADYEMPGVSGGLSTALAGIVGVLTVGGALAGIGAALRGRTAGRSVRDA
jgi:hypothetical protein